MPARRTSVIFGNNTANTLEGSAGRDIILARGGNDFIDAGAGNDIIIAGAGDDTILGGAGNDMIFGGFGGTDVAQYQGSFDDYDMQSFGRGPHKTWMISSEDEGRDILRGIEALYFAEDDLTVYIDGRNNVADAKDDAVATDENAELTIDVADLLANDRDYDGDTLVVTSVSATSAAGASVSLVDGVVTYTPGALFDSLAEGEQTTDTFTYMVDDGRGGLDEATVTVTITGRNDAPALSAANAVSVAENETAIVAGITATDVDGDVLSYAITGGADASLFDIDVTTGALSFVNAPDFEAPGDADGDNIYGVQVGVSDGNGGTDQADIAVRVTDVIETPVVDARINEIHYDNAGSDVGEFVEIRTNAGDDVSMLLIELYNGNSGASYGSVQVSSLGMTTDGTYDYYVWEPSSIQNGSPDGIALSNGGTLIEFLSYEGAMTATDGIASGATSTDIGVAEASSTEVGMSLQRELDGSWSEARAETSGGANDITADPIVARINEIHYDNAGSDVGEFVEIRTNAGDDVSTLLIELYNGNSGASYGSVQVSTLGMTSDGTYDYYVWEPSSIQNGSPDGIALSNDGVLIEFLSYEGAMTATDGVASGATSTDIGVAETSSTPTGESLQRNADGTWRAPEEETRGETNDTAPAIVARINEIHYDNAGSDVGEFVEIRTAAGDDVSMLLIELYNGNSGASYGSVQVSSLGMTTDGTYDYYVWEPSSIQNGSPDGIALSNGGTLIEFLSYEGAMTATDGVASGATSTDIGVAETSSTPTGESLQRNADGTWRAPEGDTRGGSNDGVAGIVAINEFRVSSAGDSDNTSNFVELLAAPGQSMTGMTLLALSGEFSPGQVDFAISLDGAVADENGFLLIAEASNPALGSGDVGVTGLDLFGSPQSFLVVQGFTGAVGDDLDTNDDGTFDTGPGTILASLSLVDGDTNADVNYSDNILGPDGSFTPAAGARVTDGTGDFEIESFSNITNDTPGETNEVVTPPQSLFIHDVQGSGAASFYVDQVVTVSAIVTYLVDDGFFLQEEDADADADSQTSEGIYVFAGAGATLPSLGDQVSVTGTVAEFFGETQIGNVTDITVTSSGNGMPTMAQILLSAGSDTNYENIEGMSVKLASGNSEAITVIENFNFDRFGEITVSAGNQVQATQLYDAQTQTAEIAAHIQANQNNRLLIDDNAGSNPTEFAYVPAASGDNGNGYLDADDDFTAAGPTLRLGAEIDNETTGVLRYAFGDYRMLVEGQLNIDQSTNEGARQATPDAVGGSLQIASMNVLNYFTTLSGSVGPNGLSPRGARSAEDLERQTDKLVASFIESGAEIYAVQEIENGGFGAGSAMATLVAALNAEATAQGTGAVYAFVDPTGGDPEGWIGTDAITTGIIYDTNAVNLLHSESLIFQEASAAATFALADVLNAVSSSDVSDVSRNRPAVAATFEDATTGKTFTVVSNHFKSKGDSNLQDVADAAQAHVDGGGTDVTQADIDALRADANFDQGNGQGFWNGVRADAAAEVRDWIENDYDGTGVEDYILMGDFNAYAQEDPVQTAKADGNVDLIDQFIGQDEAYSFVFDGQRGTLDQAVASGSLADDVTGLTEWHINADEPDLLGYNSQFNDARFYNDDVFASSDHDPLILGLDTSVDTFVLG